MSTWNGFTVVALPTDPPAPMSIEFSRTDISASNTSPFTGHQQIFAWGGGQQNGYAEITLTYAPMTQTQAAAWQDFLIALQGQLNVFEFSYLVPGSANCTGYWRLKNNTNKFSISEGRIYGFVLEAREVRATGLSLQSDGAASAGDNTNGGLVLIGSDIGSPVQAGSTTQNSSTQYTVSGGCGSAMGLSQTLDGNNFSADAFHFAHTTASGNTTLQGRFSASTGGFGGLMVRSDLTPGAVNVLLGPESGGYFQSAVSMASRATLNQSGNYPGPSITLNGDFAACWPVYLKLVISELGTVVTGYCSTDNSTWTQVAQVTMILPSTYYVGIAAAGANADDLISVVMDNLAISNP